MKRLSLISILLCLLSFSLRAGDAGKIVLRLMGDSTMADKDLSQGNPERGWGMRLPSHLDLGVTVVNYAQNGRSTKSVQTLGIWDRVKSDLNAGDYLFVQFGHNDAKESDPERYAPAFGAYSDNLRMFVEYARSVGAKPVLFTPCSRRWFKNGKLDLNCHTDYPEAVFRVAEELDVPVVDATRITQEWLISLGDEASRQYYMWLQPGECEKFPDGLKDDTHTNAKGARKLVELLLPAICDVIPELRNHICDCDYVVSPNGSGDFLSLAEAEEKLNPFLHQATDEIRVAQPYSVRMVMSEIARNPRGNYLDGQNGRLKWTYTTGLELRSFQDVAERYGIAAFDGYVRDWADMMADDEGNISGYKRSDYNVDMICPARIFFKLNDQFGQQTSKYAKVLENIRTQYDSHPRTSEGALWHKKIYPHQVWLDGLYMAMPFLAEYTMRNESGEHREELLREIETEFTVAEKHTYDPVTGLYRHAWDESRSMFWANPKSGQSDHAWGRANGWYSVALVEVIELLPAKHPVRKTLVGLYKKLMAELPEWADAETGMWYQVLDCPGREGNYLESTASAMFVYSYLKGLRLGILDKKLKQYALGLYPKFVETFIKENGDGTISLTDCCSVAGLGGSKMRRGDYSYYLSEAIIENDCKGVGPFIWASLEWEKITR